MKRRILITRSLSQSSALAQQLAASGFDPIVIPAIEIAEPNSFSELDTALANLDSFHWLLFTSANAVEAFVNRAGKQPLVVSPKPFSPLPTRCRIAAIGPATARAAESYGFRINLLPPQAIAESLTKALLPYTHQTDGTPTRFLLIRAEVARDHLPDTLRAAGADVTVVPAYRSVIPAGSIAAIQEMFSDPAGYPDVITFTSSSTAANLVALLEASGLRLPLEIPRVSIGPITSQTLRDLNLPPQAESPSPTVPALAATVIALLKP